MCDTIFGDNLVSTTMSGKNYFDLNNPQDIDELNRLAFDDDNDENYLPDLDLDESDESETEDNLETRSVESDTDHELDLEEIDDANNEEISDNFYSGELK